MVEVFVSYRRNGALDAAAAIADRVGLAIGRDKVFIDTRLTPGDEYPKELEEKLAECTVVLAVIHAGWVESFGVRRHKDWVKHELSVARAAGKSVIPVLINEVEPPSYAEVPGEVSAVTLIQAARVRFTHLSDDIAVLVDLVSRNLDVDLARADLSGDRGGWLGAKAATWSLPLAAVAVLTAFGLGLPPGVALLSAAAYLTVLVLLGITAVVVVMAWLSPRLDVFDKRSTARSLRQRLPDLWPVLAVFLLVLVLAIVNFASAVPGISGEVRAFVVGVLVIAALAALQRAARPVVAADVAWPPPVTPDPATFRRAAHRLRERLAAPLHPGPRRQAASVLDALASVRGELDRRTGWSLREWVTAHRKGDPQHTAPVLGVAACAVAVAVAGAVVQWTWPGALVAAVTGLLAVGLALVALVVSHRAYRRDCRRLVDELDGYEAELRPLL